MTATIAETAPERAAAGESFPAAVSGKPTTEYRVVVTHPKYGTFVLHQGDDFDLACKSITNYLQMVLDCDGEEAFAQTRAVAESRRIYVSPWVTVDRTNQP